MPHPEGSERTWTFSLDELPTSAFLELHETELESMKPGASYSAELNSGYLCTYLSINGRVIDSLGINRFVPLNSTGPVHVRLPVKPELFKRGENLLRLYQTSEKDHVASFDDCGIFQIGLVVETGQ